eukprot:1978272-Prymnesium_polylepis.1
MKRWAEISPRVRAGRRLEGLTHRGGRACGAAPPRPHTWSRPPTRTCRHRSACSPGTCPHTSPRDRATANKRRPLGCAVTNAQVTTAHVTTAHVTTAHVTTAH